MGSSHKWGTKYVIGCHLGHRQSFRSFIIYTVQTEAPNTSSERQGQLFGTDMYKIGVQIWVVPKMAPCSNYIKNESFFFCKSALESNTEF